MSCVKRIATMSFNELPIEMELKILVAASKNAADVAALRRVCTRWKLVIDSYAPIWKTLCMSLPSNNPHQAEKW